jgi:hypothetical protein
VHGVPPPGTHTHAIFLKTLKTNKASNSKIINFNVVLKIASYFKDLLENETAKLLVK